MKKRIRKKLHVGEFKQTGNVIFINTDGDEQTAETILEEVPVESSSRQGYSVSRCPYWLVSSSQR